MNNIVEGGCTGIGRYGGRHMRSITCPKCGMTSFNANDIREGYCGNCHDWTSGPVEEGEG